MLSIWRKSTYAPYARCRTRWARTFRRDHCWQAPQERRCCCWCCCCSCLPAACGEPPGRGEEGRLWIRQSSVLRAAEEGGEPAAAALRAATAAAPAGPAMSSSNAMTELLQPAPAGPRGVRLKWVASGGSRPEGPRARAKVPEPMTSRATRLGTAGRHLENAGPSAASMPACRAGCGSDARRPICSSGAVQDQSQCLPRGSQKSSAGGDR